MDIEVRLPLDNDGFIRRQCPHCDGEFKWHHGPANEEAEHAPSPTSYYCPLCGQPAMPDRWCTHAQMAHIEGVATPALMREVDALFDNAFKGLKSKGVTWKRTGRLDVPEAPSPLADEADDMVIVASPCHSYEPVKVPEDAAGPFHCLICGERFAV